MELEEQLMGNYVDHYRAESKQLRTFLGKYADFQGSCVITWITSSQKTAGEVEKIIPKFFPDAQSCDPKFESGKGIRLPNITDAVVLYGSLATLLDAMKISGGSFNVQIHENNGTPIITRKIT